MENKNIRNFVIIAHIDHGKSTLADRMLEITSTIEGRKMKDQVLDQMELERERGITIKMTPVRMIHKIENQEYILNLIDTPGHIDFSYEVSRALKAVEGAILLVDSTQGVQAQTLTVLHMARELGLTIIPTVSKIDSPNARIEEVKKEVAKHVGCDTKDVLEVSGKTGEGVPELLQAIIEHVPSPEDKPASFADIQALVFDFEYSSHKGIIVYVRMFGGNIQKGLPLRFAMKKVDFNALEVGHFTPSPIKSDVLGVGEIGYIITGIKEPAHALTGDTILSKKSTLSPLSGYKDPSPVVWASFYPESQDDFSDLKHSLERLKLTDASLAFEEETSPALGRGFQCGFLGMLHLEIVAERLKREFNLALITTTPSAIYEIYYKDGRKEKIYSPARFPDHGTFDEVYEQWIALTLIAPSEYLGGLMQLLHSHGATVGEPELLGERRVTLNAEMPLREFMDHFFDEVNRVSSGFASFSYEEVKPRRADVQRLDILIAEEVVPALSRVVASHRAYDEAKSAVEKLYEILPKQLFSVKVQGIAGGRILSSKTLSALKKDVTGHLYGGDITRKRKLWEKQKKGKKKLRERGKVNIPSDVFLKMVKRKQ
jgi:GTP-binding protein LepA